MVPSNSGTMSSTIGETDEEYVPTILNSLAMGVPHTAASSSHPAVESPHAPSTAYSRVGHDGSAPHSGPASVSMPAPEYYYQPAAQAYQYDPYYGGLMYNPAMSMANAPPYLATAASVASGQRVALPGEYIGEEEPVYVNAKQYHCILRRRQQRAKAEAENKLVKTRRPYLHQSRHNHAARRVRGPGGRFLTSEEVKAMQASGELSGNSNSASLSALEKPSDSQGQAESSAQQQEQAYTNPQGPGNAVEGAAAVYAHESHERQANAGIGRLAPGQALGTSQAPTEQSNQAGISAVKA